MLHRRDGTGPSVARHVLPGGVVAAYTVACWLRRFTVDDAFINYRVVQQLVDGQGPVFNIGERVEVTTSPLWLVVLTLVDVLLPGSLEAGALVVQGLLGVGGLALAMATSMRMARWRDPAASGPVVPVGAAAFLAPVFVWDFASGGLENGLAMAWLAATTFELVGLLRQVESGAARRRRALLVAVLVGLGPVIRPDFAVFSLGLALPMVAAWRRGWSTRSLWLPALTAAAAPVGVQLFRMGYYAQLVPNTLHAKSFSSSWWDQGWRYLWDSVSTYQLWFPMVIAGAWLLWLLRPQEPAGIRAWSWQLVVIGLGMGALLHVVGIVRVGGDYMHGRLLHPAWFASLLPIAAVPASSLRARLPAFAAIGLTAWTLMAAVGARPDMGGLTVVQGTRIVDVRSLTVGIAGDEHPVTADDFAVWPLPEAAIGWFDIADPSHDRRPYLRLRPDIGRLVVPMSMLGAPSFATSNEVFVFDRLTLADPIGARLELQQRSTPGHERFLPPAWVAARFIHEDERLPATFGSPGYLVFFTGVDLELLQPSPRELRAQRVAAAEALECGELRELIEATSAPMSPGRFVANLAASVRLHSFVLPADPVEARDQLCG